MSKRVYCLYRVSTDKQVDHDENNQADIPMQRKACHEFAEKMGWEIIREEQENGVSGFKVSEADRDKLQLIREHAAQGKFDILLVFMFDRIGCKSDETPFVVEWFSKNGIEVWSTQEGEQRFDSHTDRLTNYIRFWQADGESQKTSMRTKTALGQMVKEGRSRGGSAPYGYRLEKSGVFNKRKHEVSKLVIDEDEARVVRMMFDLCIGSGYGKWKLASFLNENGISNRKRVPCDGQTGYTMKILDSMVTEILHELFDRMKTSSNDCMVNDRYTQAMTVLRNNLQKAKHENAKLNKEYESLKGEVLKAVQGHSSFPMDLLSEMAESKRRQVISSSERITQLTLELQDGNRKMEQMKAELDRLISWSEMFDSSNMETKKMIAGYIFERVTVRANYEVEFKLSIHAQQFMQGMDVVESNELTEEELEGDLYEEQAFAMVMG